MRTAITDFKTGWYGIGMGFSDVELDRLIDGLQKLKSGEIDHFHFRSTVFETAAGGIADVELFKLSQSDQSDMVIDC
ncbi:hypothetical protein ACFQ14_09690 [Pseudahrensia aquimaris]|uniref:Uncharacterized protein n=1 Tax=Pseudahrensia aquimaris TaxID=744461 RepID=A0ABW3FG10_9HYPH